MTFRLFLSLLSCSVIVGCASPESSSEEVSLPEESEIVDDSVVVTLNLGVDDLNSRNQATSYDDVVQTGENTITASITASSSYRTISFSYSDLGVGSTKNLKLVLDFSE